jgi:endonuclease YncB( thermonuclease family)
MRTTWKPLSNETKPLTFLLALTFLISGSTTVSAKQKFGDYEGATYVRNYDGDTITFNLPNLHPSLEKKYVFD